MLRRHYLMYSSICNMYLVLLSAHIFIYTYEYIGVCWPVLTSKSPSREHVGVIYRVREVWRPSRKIHDDDRSIIGGRRSKLKFGMVAS